MEILGLTPEIWKYSKIEIWKYSKIEIFKD